MAEHSGTHIDALCHQAENLEMYGGVRVDARGADARGLHAARDRHGARRCSRAACCSTARDAGHAIGAEDLERAAEGLEITPGDVILVRTRRGRAVGTTRTRSSAAGGIDAERRRAGAPSAQPLAVGADNMAWDVPGEDDPELGSLPGHLILLVREGIYIIEALNLEELARDGVREFAFACLPLKLRGGTGSPVRPIALV